MTTPTAADRAEGGTWLKWTILIAAIGVFGGLFFQAFTSRPPAGFSPPGAHARSASAAAPFYRSQFIPNTSAQSVHSAAAVELAGGRLRAFWYGGTREGAADVAIYTAVYAPNAGGWSPERVVIARADAQRRLGRYIRKLGNPVVTRDRGGRLWLFFVSVSVGGWSGSAINSMVSEDQGETWSPPQRLIASPFLNLSTLVKGPPFFFSDGTIGLPVYHEMLGKFGELLRLDADGHVVHKTRLSRGRSSLQPVIVPWSQTEAVGFMRYAGDPPGRVLMTRTTDGGEHWSPPVKTELPNPNAAVGGVLLADDRLLLAFNNSQDDRRDLTLAYSADQGTTWRIVHALEGSGSRQEPEQEYSYPWLLRDGAGDVHVLYTWNRTRIKHVHFNPAWLEQRL